MCLSWVQPWDGPQCAARGGEIWLQYDWNDLPAGREFDGKFLKNVKSSSTLKNAGGKERRAELRRSARRQQFIITVSSWRFYNWQQWQEEVLDQKSPKVVDRVVLNYLTVDEGGVRGVRIPQYRTW